MRGGDEALNRNFNEPEKESIIYNSLGFVIPTYKYAWDDEVYDLGGRS